LAPAVVAEAVAALDLAPAALVAVLPAALLPVVALVVLLLQFPARLLREAQLLRPVLLPEVAAVRLVPLPQQPEVAAVVLVQGLVASESLRSR
jgi:hypothetical protein